MADNEEQTRCYLCGEPVGTSRATITLQTKRRGVILERRGVILEKRGLPICENCPRPATERT